MHSKHTCTSYFPLPHRSSTLSHHQHGQGISPRRLPPPGCLKNHTSQPSWAPASPNALTLYAIQAKLGTSIIHKVLICAAPSRIRCYAMTLRSANAIGETDVTLGTASSSGVIKTRMVMSCQRTVRPVTRTFDHVLGTSEVRRWRIEKVQAGKESDMKGSMPLTIPYDQVILNEGKDRSSRYNLLIVLLPYLLGSLLDHFSI